MEVGARVMTPLGPGLLTGTEYHEAYHSLIPKVYHMLLEDGTKLSYRGGEFWGPHGKIEWSPEAA